MRFLTLPLQSFFRLYKTMYPTVTIANQDIAVKGCSSTDEFNQVMAFQPFKDWLQAFEEQQKQRKNEFDINSIDIQNIDYFGSKKVGFVKFKADVSFKDTGKSAPGIVFMVRLPRWHTCELSVFMHSIERRCCFHVDYSQNTRTER